MSRSYSADQYVAMSCINVGVGPGGTTSMLAKIAIVDFNGKVILETFVAPTMPVVDHREATTGIKPSDLHGGLRFDQLQQYIAQNIKGKILVGHSIWNDLSVLGIPHPAVDTRDVALYQPFRNALRSPHQVIGLQTLAWQLMRRRCQESALDPVENARVAMDLYRSHGQEWETAVSKGNWPCTLPPSTFSRCYT